MSDLTRILIFGGFALLLLAGLQAFRLFNDRKNARLSTNFSKNYGLIFIASVAGALTVITTTEETRTGAFTLLGTIAGYLAGAKQTSTTAEGTGAPAKGETEPESNEGLTVQRSSENDL